MKYILKNLRAEFIKSQRTLVYWLMILCPLILAGLVFLIFNADNQDMTKAMTKSKENPWVKFYQIHYQILCVLFLPLYIAMANNLIYAKEHQFKMWKHLYALPVPKWSVFVAKSLFSLITLSISFLIYALLIMFSGYLLNYIYPKFIFNQHNLLFFNHLALMLRLFIGALGVWAIHNWLSLRFGNFALSIGIAILSVVITPIVLQSGDKLGSWMFVYPYIYSLSVFQNPNDTKAVWDFTQTPILLSMGVAVVFSVIGYLEYKRKAIQG
jgi:lantibiotic transport system permease protein